MTLVCLLMEQMGQIIRRVPIKWTIISWITENIFSSLFNFEECHRTKKDENSSEMETTYHYHSEDTIYRILPEIWINLFYCGIDTFTKNHFDDWWKILLLKWSTPWVYASTNENFDSSHKFWTFRENQSVINS